MKLEMTAVPTGQFTISVSVPVLAARFTLNDRVTVP